MQFAACVLLGFFAHLRPKESFALQGEDLGRSLTSKIGTADVSVLLDTPFLQFLEPGLELAARAAERPRPVDFEYKDMLPAFVEAARSLVVDALPY